MSIRYATSTSLNTYQYPRSYNHANSTQTANALVTQVVTSSQTVTLPSNLINGTFNYVIVGGGGPGGGVGGGGGGGAGSIFGSTNCFTPCALAAGPQLNITIGAGGVPATATVPATCGGTTSICIACGAGPNGPCNSCGSGYRYFAVGGGHAGGGSACPCTSYPLGCWNARIPIPPLYSGNEGGSGGGGSFGGNLTLTPCNCTTEFIGGCKGYGAGRSNYGGPGSVFFCNAYGAIITLNLGGGGGGAGFCGGCGYSPLMVPGATNCNKWTSNLAAGGAGACLVNCYGYPLNALDCRNFTAIAGGGGGGGRNINCSCSPVAGQPTGLCLTPSLPGVRYIIPACQIGPPPGNRYYGYAYGGGAAKPVYLATCFAGNSYPGAANTGSGGGGSLMIGCGPNCIQGGAGGSGVVILWYRVPNPG